MLSWSGWSRSTTVWLKISLRTVEGKSDSTRGSIKTHRFSSADLSPIPARINSASRAGVCTDWDQENIHTQSQLGQIPVKAICVNLCPGKMASEWVCWSKNYYFTAPNEQEMLLHLHEHRVKLWCLSHTGGGSLYGSAKMIMQLSSGSF